jgi:hypothetical protein
MKVYLSKYRSHWLSPYTILEHVCFWRVFEDYNDPWVEKWASRLEPLCLAWQWFLDRVHPKIDYVKIDYWDNSNSWQLNYSPINCPTADVHMVYVDPKATEIVPLGFEK